MESVQTVVIGAGVVGLAVARELALSGREVVILEREGLIGSVTSARNSEVIHAGIYYPAGSLKARLCVTGKHALYDYCTSRHVAHDRCGKLIVAADAEEARRLDGIAAAAAANGVDDIARLTGAEARALEPELSCEAALLSASTGIVDSHGLMVSLLGEAQEAGAMLALGTEVTRLGVAGSGFEVETPEMTLAAAEVVNSAGHGAPGLAPRGAPAQFFAKGSYFALTGKGPFRRLIYPVPVNGGLGVHSTRDLQGRTKFGPDVEWVGGEDYTVDPAGAERFYDVVRRYWPALPDGALLPDYAGVRPKIAGPGEPAADFRIDGAAAHGLPGYVGLYGIESPGLTACLAIGAHVRAVLEADLRMGTRRTA